VQAVVNDRVGGHGAAGSQGVEHCLVRSRLHEVNDGRCAAEGRGACTVEEVVGGGEAADGHAQVDVAVDGPGDDVVTGGVDLAPAAQPVADGGDLFAGDGDVGREDGRSGDDGAVADDEIRVVAQVGHGVIVVPSARAAKFAAGINEKVAVMDSGLFVRREE